MEVDSPKISDLVLHERHVEHPRAPGLVRLDAAHVVTCGARRQGREQRAQRDLELGPRSRRPSSHRPFGVTLGGKYDEKYLNVEKIFSTVEKNIWYMTKNICCRKNKEKIF